MVSACGIYAITHIASGKRYVGQSVNIANRMRAHRSYLRNGTHENPKLSRAVAKHGIEAVKEKHLAARNSAGCMAKLAARDRSPETRAKKSVGAKAGWATPELREKRIAALRAGWAKKKAAMA